MSKIQFWKQFTTNGLSIISLWNCIRYVKDTILKAIYNLLRLLPLCLSTVFDMSKIQFWKQFTTYSFCALSLAILYSICQRYNFESNLQRDNELGKSTVYCIRYVKDTILKAIYNYPLIYRLLLPLYSICQRYNFESNLQHSPGFFGIQNTVFDMSKIQFWKQFTTQIMRDIFYKILYSICQRYNFESNLQRVPWLSTYFFNCIRYVKDTILKAIYNKIYRLICAYNTVFDMSKIQFWKQFTTFLQTSFFKFPLYSICQRYNFESNLQHGSVVASL